MSLILRKNKGSKPTKEELDNNFKYLSILGKINTHSLNDTVLSNDTKYYKIKKNTDAWENIDGIYYNKLEYTDYDGQLYDIDVNYGYSYLAKINAHYQMSGKIYTDNYTSTLYTNTNYVESSKSFYIGSGFNNLVRDSIALPNGGFLIVGSFTKYNGVDVYRIAKLYSNGNLDLDFNKNIGAGFDGNANTICRQSDGKILIGGYFNNFNENYRHSIVRLNADGTEDVDFYSNLGTAFSGTINNITLFNNKILATGLFSLFNGNSVGNIVALNIDGTPYTTFNDNLDIGFDESVTTIDISQDNKIYIGGDFSHFKSNYRKCIVKLNFDGTEDIDFYNNMGTSFNSAVMNIHALQDGRLLTCGYFNSFNGNSVPNILMMFDDGTIDDSFMNNINFTLVGGFILKAISVNDKIYIGGLFDTTNTKSNFLVLDTTGNLNNTDYNMTNTDLISFNGVITTIILSSDKLLVCGGYNQLHSVNLNKICMLNSNGTNNTYTQSKYINTSTENMQLTTLNNKLYLSSMGNIEYSAYNITIYSTVGGSTGDISSS